jgi:hypothetical protein
MSEEHRKAISEQSEKGRFDMTSHRFRHNPRNRRASTCFKRQVTKRVAAVEFKDKKSRGSTKCGTNSIRSTLHEFSNVPCMNIAILITGSRGDVQPFLALAHTLQAPPYSHRGQICTHPSFQSFHEKNGVEFHSTGGDPEKLMAYAVKNPGIMPNRQSMKDGDVVSRSRSGRDLESEENECEAQCFGSCGITK